MGSAASTVPCSPWRAAPTHVHGVPASQPPPPCTPTACPEVLGFVHTLALALSFVTDAGQRQPQGNSPKQCWGCRGGCHGTHRHGAPQAVGCCKALLQLSVWCCYLGSSCSFGLFFFFPANAAALLLLSCHAPGQTNMHAGRHACTRVCALRAARPVFDAHHPGQQHSPHHPLRCSPSLCIEAAGADARRLSMVWASCQPQLGAVTREP